MQHADSFWPPAPQWRAWRHVTKLDPDRPLSPGLLEAVYTSGTDAIMLGGSTGMTREAVLGMLSRLQEAPVPVALEVSSLESAMPGAGLFFIPLVLNTADAGWMGGAQAMALRNILPVYGSFIPWHLLVPEAYLVLNPDSTVARLTGADTALDSATAAAYAAFAGRVLRLPLIYVEYSGTFGDMDLLRAVAENAGDAHVVYGGGILAGEQAARAGAHAGTVVVGNLVYRDPGRLRETVAAVK
ncbi:MAG TPA: heptaprenylglyceryl phosphate synthase [Symbiobacteriaceae bacterium]|nr:heptaprenylglyceryl phosphate synthase [Symbiobacteriaceae bacterium]